MGIPSYFRHLILNHRNIISVLNSSIKIHNFYIDANSIIYDNIKRTTYNNINNNNNNEYETIIINKVITDLQSLIETINPINNIIIAFDGIPPIAKVKQQRNRRYINTLQKQFSNLVNTYDTCNISPGTLFMKKLDKNITEYFINFNPNIMVYGSNINGEGEHKIFDYIRNNTTQHTDYNTVIYGIDADLFMISLSNLKHCKEIYLYRETPEFINSIDNTLQPNKLYILSINELAKTVYYNLTGANNITTTFYDKLNDYVFICLLLGNDFLPHFPSLNIKNNGISTLMDLYRTLFKSDTFGLTKNNSIIWKNFKKFIFKLSENETVMLKSVYTLRDKLEKYKLQNFNRLNEQEQYNIYPTINRNIEKFINIYEECWEMRYYYSLCHINITELQNYYNEINNISNNYLETLEWNFIYYTSGCINQYHYYKYDYPPLLTDLYKNIPIFDTKFITYENKPIINVNTLLALILPINSHNLLNKKLSHYLLKYNKYYSFSIENINTAFCSFLWEGHLPFLENEEYNIEKINKEIINLLE